MKIYQSFSSAKTKSIAERLAKEIAKNGPKKAGAAVLALDGDLGAGKTTFVQGFMRGLGIKKRAASPTFILIRRSAIHRGETSFGFHNVYHADFYRLHSATELRSLDFQKIFREPTNIILIEWAEKIGKALPRGTRYVKFFHGRLESERIIKFAN